MGKHTGQLPHRLPQPSHGAAVFLILALGLLAYSNMFQAPFIFDDRICIVENERLHDPSKLMDVVTYSPSRALAMLSFSLNYAVCGLNVACFHLVSLLFHLCAALALWWLLRLLFDSRLSAHSTLGRTGALLGALLFVVHPVNTQAVIYSWQRSTLMAALGYFLALACFVRMRLAFNEGRKPEAQRFLGLSLLAALAAMFSKEIAFTLPFTILAMELCIFHGHKPLPRLWLAPFAASLLVIPLTVLSFSDYYAATLPAELQGYTPVSPLHYLMTQARVMVTYFRLMVLPIHQQLDYDYPLVTQFQALLLPLLLITATIYLAWRVRRTNPHLAFGICWFYLAHAVEALTFVLPDVIFEHRLYLPSAAACLCLLALLPLLKNKIRLVLLPAALLVLLLTVLTWQRNQLWRTPLDLWTQNLEYAPLKARVWLSRALVYRQQQQLPQALIDAENAAALSPRYRLAHVTRGLLLAALNKHLGAVKAYDQALQLMPADSDMHNARGVSLLELGRAQEALADFDAALALRPGRVQTLTYRGAALDALNRRQEALVAFGDALAVDDAFPQIYLYRAPTLIKLQREEEAIADYQRLLELDQDNRKVYVTLARLLYGLGRVDEAGSLLDRTIALFPDYGIAYFNRAVIQFANQQWQAAVDDLSVAIDHQPSAQAFYRRGLAWKELGNETACTADLQTAKDMGL